MSTAARYWLLRYGDDELRFTHRVAAERWASQLAERGISSHLTWHDDNTPLRPGSESEPTRRVA
jgi:hypothetical protein